MTTNDKTKAVVEQYEEIVADDYTQQKLAQNWQSRKDWLQHRLETLVREEREELYENLTNQLYGMNLNITGKEQQNMFRELEYVYNKYNKYTPPITNNKN